MKIAYIKELDGVRGVAALMVMFFHFFQAFPDLPGILHVIKKFSMFGQTGVSLFFVLSGFLITRLLMAAKGSQRFFYNFYWRRSLRIFPLYFAFLAFYYFVLPFMEGKNIPSFDVQVYYWFYLQDFANTFQWPSKGPFHFWSLAVEEHFYLFWPFVVYFSPDQKIARWIFAIIGIAFLTRIVLVSLGYEVFYFTFSRMDELAVGAFLAVMEWKGRLRKDRRAARRFLSFFVITLVPTMLLWTVFSGTGHGSMQVVKFIFISLSYFSLMGFIIASDEDMGVNRFLSSAPLKYTGRISYGLYVYHPVCFMLFEYVYPSAPILLRIIGAFVTSYIVASVSFYLFERRFLDLKRFFEDKPYRKAARSAVPESVAVSIEK